MKRMFQAQTSEPHSLETSKQDSSTFVVVVKGRPKFVVVAVDEASSKSWQAIDQRSFGLASLGSRQSFEALDKELD